MVTFRGERAVGAIFDRMIDAVFLVDDGGRCVRVNPAAEELTGRSSKELQAMAFFELTPAADVKDARSMFREGTRSGESSLIRKDGTAVEVEYQAITNILSGLHLALVRDVTARNRDARQLRRAARLQEATAAMSAAVDTVQVAEVILAAGEAALDAQCGHVVVLVESGHWAEIVTAAGVAAESEAQSASEFRAEGLPTVVVNGRHRFAFDVPTMLGDIFRSDAPIRLQQLRDLDPTRTRFSPAERSAAMVCLPLVTGGTLVGGLYLFWAAKQTLSDDEATCAATLATLCAQSLDRARLYVAEREARKRAEDAARSVLEYQGKLERMPFDRMVIAERERHQLAVALHDGVTQYLALARMALGPLRQGLVGAKRKAVQAAITHIDNGIKESRALSFGLSPPLLYDLGIKAALSWLGEKLQKSTGLRIELASDGPVPKLDDVTASVVYRTVRELLMNVAKHAHSAAAKVSLRSRPDELDIVVEDSGMGFDPAKAISHAGFGLMAAREQVGRVGGVLEITSAPAEGTRIVMRVPHHRPPSPDPFEDAHGRGEGV